MEFPLDISLAMAGAFVQGPNSITVLLILCYYDVTSITNIINATNLVQELWSEIAPPYAHRHDVGEQLARCATEPARADLVGEVLDLVQGVVHLLKTGEG